MYVPGRAWRAYNVGVARGWESKSVEGQIESFASERRSLAREPVTEAQLERENQRHMLLLSRTRVMHDIENCRNPRHLELLQNSLAYLDAKLAEIGGNNS